ncbi:hypothetical protein RIF29_23368 [Crotalaria pallida]|uniref:K Homology domain-containing protein n=1 Tax=Crotalaria pallida TaxID=3830 RepID=A0AAN9FAB0_CROPI
MKPGPKSLTRVTSEALLVLTLGLFATLKYKTVHQISDLSSGLDKRRWLSYSSHLIAKNLNQSFFTKNHPILSLLSPSFSLFSPKLRESLLIRMSGEVVFDGQDAGYVPENPDFLQNQPDEGNVIDDESGFPQLQPDEDDAGNLPEVDANQPENEFDVHGVEDLLANADAIPQEHITEEEHHDGGDVTENFPSQEVQGPEANSKPNEIKKWPGWPGENVFRMLVPVQKVGSIIGRKGEFIKKITEETKARIKILDGPPGTTERAVVSKYE